MGCICPQKGQATENKEIKERKVSSVKNPGQYYNTNLPASWEKIMRESIEQSGELTDNKKGEKNEELFQDSNYQIENSFRDDHRSWDEKSDRNYSLIHNKTLKDNATQYRNDQYKTQKFTVFKDTIINLSRMFDVELGSESRLDDNLAQKMHMYAFEKDRYLFLEDLGCGATAEVQKARDKRKANYVAIKRFRSKNKKFGFYEAKIMCEMKKLEGSENMFLTKCKKIAWDRQADEIDLILIIDIGVCSLSDLIKRRAEENQRYSENEIILILQDILKGLSVLEKLKIVHGDIKPDNILYCRNPSRYVITDFGISQFVFDDWRTTPVVSRGHTFKYLAPAEEGFPNPFKGDVWALGISILDLVEFNDSFKLIDLMKELHESGLTDEFVAKYIKKGKYTPIFLEVLKGMLTWSSEDRLNAEALLHMVTGLIEKKKEVLKEAIGESSKPQKKNLYAFQIQEENYAKRVEEQKVVNMSSEAEKIQFIDDFIEEYDKLFDFNYCMRLTEKKLEILENKGVQNNSPELYDERRGGDEAKVRTLLNLAKYCRLSEYHAIRTVNELQKYESLLQGYFETHPLSESEYLLNFGSIHKNLGNFNEAKQILHKALQRRKTNNKDSPLDVGPADQNLDITKYLDELGMVYLETAEYETALNYFKKSLDIKINLKNRANSMGNSNSANVELEKSYNNIGLAYLKMWKLVEALEILSYNISQVGDQLKLEHINPNTAFTFALIGKIKEEEGVYREAYKNYNKYKEILVALNITKEHPDIARSCLYLGNLYERIGLYQKAISQYEEAIEICKRCFDNKESLILADCYSYLGSVYGKMAKYKKAEELYEESLKQYKQLYVPNSQGEIFHQNISNIHIKKGILFLELGKTKLAKQSLKTASNVVHKLFGKGNHPDEAVIYNKLGYLNFRNGKHVKAIKFHKQAISIIVNVYKISDNRNFHPEIARTLNHMGMIHVEYGIFDEAEKNFEKSRQTYEAFFKGPHPEKARTLYYRGLLYQKRGDNQSLMKSIEEINASLEMQRTVYKTEKKDQDPAHPDIVACYRELGAVEEKLGNFTKAIEFTEKSINLSEKVYKSEEHLDLTLAWKQLANIYCKSGDLVNSEKILEKALETGKKLLTELHPEYISILKTQLSIYKDKGNKDQERFEKALNVSERIRDLEESINKQRDRLVLDMFLVRND